MSFGFQALASVSVLASQEVPFLKQREEEVQDRARETGQSEYNLMQERVKLLRKARLSHKV